MYPGGDSFHPEGRLLSQSGGNGEFGRVTLSPQKRSLKLRRRYRWGLSFAVPLFCPEVSVRLSVAWWTVRGQVVTVRRVTKQRG